MTGQIWGATSARNQNRVIWIWNTVHPAYGSYRHPLSRLNSESSSGGVADIPSDKSNVTVTLHLRSTEHERPW